LWFIWVFTYVTREVVGVFVRFFITPAYICCAAAVATLKSILHPPDIW
jgi:hypothetical protein